MLPDRVSNPGPLTYESGALPIALRGPAAIFCGFRGPSGLKTTCFKFKTSMTFYKDLDLCTHNVFIYSSG